MTPSRRALVVVALCGTLARAAQAACVIGGARPQGTLPTLGAGETFSFLASADCETLRFTVRGETLSKMPMSGPDAAAGDRTYRVVLSQSEWDSVVDETDTTFTWTIRGTTSAGVVTRLTTTNEIDHVFDLSTADAKFVEHREEAVVSSAGDFDGDGHGDLLFGSQQTGAGLGHSRSAFVVFGPVHGTYDLSSPDAQLVEENNRAPFEQDWVGWSVAGEGDVDGDGIDDVLVGATGDVDDSWYGGAAYLVHGPVTGRFDLADANAKLVGEANLDLAGFSLSLADVNADDHDDLLVGAEGHGAGGAAYVVLGPVTGTHSLSVADAKLIGQADDIAGFDLSAADTNGDGHDDIVVGAPGSSEGGTDAGAAYLVLGPVTGPFDLAFADAMLVGEEADDEAGHRVAGAGDVNGDGNDDLLVGASQHDRGGDSAGAAYLVLGPATGTRDLSTADAILVGEEADDHAGYDVSGLGDVDGDGHDDVMVGAHGNGESGSEAGAAYVVNGPVSGAVDLSLADSKFVGENSPDNSDRYAGLTVAGAGDVDADGRADLLIGTYGGAAYLVYGSSL